MCWLSCRHLGDTSPALSYSESNTPRTAEMCGSPKIGGDGMHYIPSPSPAGCFLAQEGKAGPPVSPGDKGDSFASNDRRFEERCQNSDR